MNRTPGKMCEVKGCLNEAKYNLYRRNPDGTKTWLQVCDYHEREIGDENMRRAGGRYEPQRVVEEVKELNDDGKEKKQKCPECGRRVSVQPADGTFRAHKRYAGADWCSGSGQSIYAEEGIPR